MFGRVAGVLIGVAILASGLGLWKPAVAARYQQVVDFARLPLGDFGQHRTILAFLIVAVGLAVAAAALQREGDRPSAKPTVTALPGEEPEHAAAPH